MPFNGYILKGCFRKKVQTWYLLTFRWLASDVYINLISWLYSF